MGGWLLLPRPLTLLMADQQIERHGPAWIETWSTQWGGHIKGGGMVSRPAEDSILSAAGADETLYDGFTNFRLKNLTTFNPQLFFEGHYEVQFTGGDLYRMRRRVEENFSQLGQVGYRPTGRIDDEKRLFDLTGVLVEEEDYLLYHRIDRLLLNYQSHWGTIIAGRQALTMGNGLLFNPMDLFNPFAPTDMERDYKVGDDMLVARCNPNPSGELGLIYVPRRDPVTGEIAWESSSLAANYHILLAAMEMDLLMAKHYREGIVGLGGSGSLRDAAFRVDATWTEPQNDSSGDGYPSLVANLDYAWIWWRKNFYGFIEYYHNGLGHVDPAKALEDPLLREKIKGGEIFTLGKNYLGSQIQVELHPLLRLEANLILNLDDGSGLTQPRILWDMAQDWRLTGGARVPFGEEGSEYGGFPITGTPFTQVPLTSLFLWLTYYY